MKDTVKRIKRQTTDWEKVFVKDTFDKVPLSKIYRELLRHDKKISNPSKKWARDP